MLPISYVYRDLIIAGVKTIDQVPVQNKKGEIIREDVKKLLIEAGKPELALEEHEKEIEPESVEETEPEAIEE